MRTHMFYEGSGSANTIVLNKQHKDTVSTWCTILSGS